MFTGDLRAHTAFHGFQAGTDRLRPDQGTSALSVRGTPEFAGIALTNHDYHKYFNATLGGRHPTLGCVTRTERNLPVRLRNDRCQRREFRGHPRLEILYPAQYRDGDDQCTDWTDPLPRHFPDRPRGPEELYGYRRIISPVPEGTDSEPKEPVQHEEDDERGDPCDDADEDRIEPPARIPPVDDGDPHDQAMTGPKSGIHAVTAHAMAPTNAVTTAWL